MADPFVGQVSPFAFPFAPLNWAFCDGSTVPINQYGSLFSLIGFSFGGNSSSKFGLPNLNSAAPCGQGQGPGLTNRVLGQSFGSATVTLDSTTLGSHNHGANVVELGRGDDPSNAPATGAGLASPAQVNAFANGTPNAAMSPNAITATGFGGSHNNLQPYIAINYCIALLGEYPSFP